MTQVQLEVRRKSGEFSPKATPTLEIALDRYCRALWPHHTGPSVQREWGLTRDEAREVLRCRASKGVLNKISHHPRGGFRVMLALIEAATGCTLDAWLADRRDRAWRELERATVSDFPGAGARP